ncbi:hypothetical protein POTOM_061309 [Populus tomentosa]|uniref:Uncharacterized protein n=1 Tax=Populus tomentosa TaxID=118781 RepID=A0A8X7XMH3_POPTO|nr:hypothetical protein POTOM_061309 [Populus tomentosa]
MTKTLPIHHPPLPTKTIPIHHPPLTTTARTDQHAHILSQSSIATLSSSKYPNHPIIFARNSPVTLVIPSASTTKSLGLSSHDTAPPISHPIKLFFERFPFYVEYQDLKKTFFKFGRVTKLFLFKRKTALGRRFGFVDILSPMFVIDLYDQASNLWTYKLRVFTSTKPQVVYDERKMVQYDSIYEDKEWLHRSLVGKILPNADVATMEEMILKSIDKVVSFRFLEVSQVCLDIHIWATDGRLGIGTTLIFSCRVGETLLAMTPFMLARDPYLVEVSLTEIKGKYIPSLIKVKHSMDVSLYTASVLFNDDEDDQGDAIMRATSSHRATGQRVEFEFDPIDTLGEDEASSSFYRSSSISSAQAHDPLLSDSWDEANACWESEGMVLSTRSMGSIVVWNVYGLGGRDKKKNVDWYAVPSLGFSGGIFYIWNPASFCVSSYSVAINGSILHVEGIFTRYNLNCLVSFVYAPIDGTLKKELWNYLITFKDSVSKPWCFAGNFNKTLSPLDKKGGSKVSASMTRFKHCINGCELIDLPLNGKKVYLVQRFYELGPKPFRFMSCWWLVSDFSSGFELYAVVWL